MQKVMNGMTRPVIHNNDLYFLLIYVYLLYLVDILDRYLCTRRAELIS